MCSIGTYVAIRALGALHDFLVQSSDRHVVYIYMPGTPAVNILRRVVAIAQFNHHGLTACVWSIHPQKSGWKSISTISHNRRNKFTSRSRLNCKGLVTLTICVVVRVVEHRVY